MDGVPGRRLQGARGRTQRVWNPQVPSHYVWWGTVPASDRCWRTPNRMKAACRHLFQGSCCSGDHSLHQSSSRVPSFQPVFI